MDNKGYITLWTDWQKQENFTEIVNTIKKYLEENKWDKKSERSIEEKFRISEEPPKERYERQGIQVYTNYNGQCITFYRRQKSPENPLYLDFCLEIDIGSTPKKDLGEKITRDIQALSKFLKEKKD